jgi:hypothetical protein
MHVRQITMPSLEAVFVICMNSPVHLSELYSYKFRLSMARGGRACRRRRRRGRAGERILGWR